MFRTWPVAHRLALPETGEHGRGGSKHSACSSKKVRKIARMFLSDAEILSGRGPGCTGLEGGVSEVERCGDKAGRQRGVWPCAEARR